ncbi:GDSL-type esterase/lipase family protein [Pseudomonas sp. Gutcm_11s]|uniref:GDSL-type esterase/lipase family protein n=1 Tax=Pseudomonas sp. Gutcm_11s TaxID=3026088 RepID=UPI00235E7BE8|nr:GDSL-type esterase/lipase family protein [Pseudomonas sp. Gutcm_11s]MDD0843051.1 GDSL-type esterase/lipase family protein [Pseudomonas sp. Gutcm_11s]
MRLSADLRRRAGLLLLAAVLLFACYKALDAGRQSAPPVSREQRVAAAYAALHAAEGRGTLVLLGDSITAGRRWSAGPGCPLPLNLGVSGATSGELRQHLQLASRAGAERALLMIGINDLRNAVPLSELVANYRAILANLAAAGITPILQSTLRVTPLQVDHQAINRQVDELNQQLRQWARQQGWRYLDVQAVVTPRGYLGDGLHLNAEGYGAWQHLIDPLLCAGSEQPGQAQQPPGQDQHLHQQAGEAQPDEQRAGADQVRQ